MPASAFFAGLKTKDERPGNLGAALGERLGGVEQNRHVAVVPARVHFADVLRAIRRLAELGNRKRIDVGAQERDGARFAALERPEQSGLADPGPQIVKTHLAKMLLEIFRGVVLHERELGIHMEVPADLDELFGDLRTIEQHTTSLCHPERSAPQGGTPGCGGYDTSIEGSRPEMKGQNLMEVGWRGR